jgi:hypothetical protein
VEGTEQVGLAVLECTLGYKNTVIISYSEYCFSTLKFIGKLGSVLEKGWEWTGVDRSRGRMGGGGKGREGVRVVIKIFYYEGSAE